MTALGCRPCGRSSARRPMLTLSVSAASTPSKSSRSTSATDTQSRAPRLCRAGCSEASRTQRPITSILGFEIIRFCVSVLGERRASTKVAPHAALRICTGIAARRSRRIAFSTKDSDVITKHSCPVSSRPRRGRLVRRLTDGCSRCERRRRGRSRSAGPCPRRISGVGEVGSSQCRCDRRAPHRGRLAPLRQPRSRQAPVGCHRKYCH